MFVIVVYDVNVQRVSKVCKFLRTTLRWVQNSVFEGEITESQFERIKHRLSEIVNKNEDSVLIYVVSAEKWVQRQVLGVDKNSTTNFL
jgi:CRISPR-associated protein Cas2